MSTRASVRSRFAHSVLALAIVCSVACERLAPGVTCNGVRKLNLGMTPAEVRNILGRPLSQFVASDRGTCGRPAIRECWSYSSSDRFSVDFDDHGVASVSAYRKALMSDRSIEIFTLTRELPNRYFGPGFQSYFNCSQ